MRNYFRTVAVIGVVFAVAIAIYGVVTWRDDSSSQVDGEMVLILNDIAREAENREGLAARLSSKNYSVDYVILDENNSVICDSRTSGSLVTVESAVKSRYPYQYVIKDGKVAGTVVLIDDNMSEYRSQWLTVIIGLGICGFVIIAGALIYGLFVKRNIITPFRKMEQFAGKVAEGNLDEPLMIERNNMFGSFSESFDIMREELSASREREIALQKKEKELVASLSHDLKTPITGIKLTAELLKARLEMSNDDSGMADKLDNIYKKADQIDALVTDLFASTLDDLGEFKVSCQDEPSSVITEIIGKYDDRNLVAASDVPGVIVHVDTKRLSQVIGNIINNSYKYANTAIDVEYKVNDGFLEMRMQDHGPGIPSDELDLVTNKFYRGKAQSASGAEGSGLGLYIAKTLMTKMDGDMILSSDGDGLVIILLIPLG